MKTYYTCCTSSSAEKIEKMVDQAKQISYKKLLKHVDQAELDETFSWYHDIPLSLENDYGVSFWKSKYDNEECVYVEHSRIEYIFI